MTSKRIDRALEVTQWARKPMTWAIRLRLAPGPFKALRKLPLMALCRICGLQALASEKIAR